MTTGCLYRWNCIFYSRSVFGRFDCLVKKYFFQKFRSTGVEQDVCVYNVSYDTKPVCHRLR